MPETYNIVRNTVTKALKTFKIVKGDNKDKEYLCPEITEQTWEDDAKWVGLPNVINVVQTFLKRTFQQLHFDNLNDDGSFSMEKFLAEAADFTSTGMKLKDIQEKLDEIQEQASILIQTGDIGTDKVTGEESADLKKVRELNNSIIVLRAMKEARSRKKADTADEPAVAVA